MQPQAIELHGFLRSGFRPRDSSSVPCTRLPYRQVRLRLGLLAGFDLGGSVYVRDTFSNPQKEWFG